MSEEHETVVQEVVDDAQQQDTSQESQPESVSTSDVQERNWREMRQTMDELKKHNYELQAEIARIHSPKQEVEEEYTDEDISTVGITKKLIQKEAAKIAKEIVREREATTVEERLRFKFQDYDSVVNERNLKSLFETAPELVKMLKANQDDPYEQALAAYKLLKKFGGAEESMQLKENQAKPRSVQSVGSQSALSQAHAFSRGMTPDLKKQLWQEMKDAAKGA